MRSRRLTASIISNRRQRRLFHSVIRGSEEQDVPDMRPLRTPHSDWQYRVLTFPGADGFFTDHCDRLLRFYGRKSAAEPEAILAKYGY